MKYEIGWIVFMVCLTIFLLGTPNFSEWTFVSAYKAHRNENAKQCEEHEKEYANCDTGLFHACVKSGYNMGTRDGILSCVRDLCSLEAVENKEEYWKCAAQYR